MSILNVNVHTMTVTKCESDKCMEESLRCRQLSEDLLAWEDINQVSNDRILRIDTDEFRGNVFITNALGGPPNFLEVPKLRFYESGWVHVSTVSMSGDGTPWLMCVCDDRCAKCTDHECAI